MQVHFFQTLREMRESWRIGSVGIFASSCWREHFMWHLCGTCCVLSIVWDAVMQRAGFIHWFNHSLSHIQNSLCYLNIKQSVLCSSCRWMSNVVFIHNLVKYPTILLAWFSVLDPECAHLESYRFNWGKSCNVSYPQDHKKLLFCFFLNWGVTFFMTWFFSTGISHPPHTLLSSSPFSPQNFFPVLLQ